MIRKGAFVLGFAAIFWCISAAAQVQRSFVASYGSDANTVLNCTFLNPCRSFASAQTVTVSGGEIVALDAAGYAAITITKSLTITANPGYYAGISASTGIGVNIPTAGVKVTLRGLNINGVGTGSTAVSMTAGVSLTIENCVIYGFYDGIFINAPTGAVRITNTIVRDNNDAGIYVAGGMVTITNSKFTGNFWVGVWAVPNAGNTATIVASDTDSSGNGWGFVALKNTGTAASVMVTRVTASGNAQSGIQAEAGGIITVGYSNISANGYGLANVNTATVESMNNNLVRGNGTQTFGTITGATGMTLGPITNAVGQ